MMLERKKRFYLLSTLTGPRGFLRKCVRRITRVNSLQDWEVKMFLMQEFYYQTERAVSIGSQWSFRSLAKPIIRILQDIFPSDHFVGERYLSEVESRIALIADRIQRIKIDRMEYEKDVCRAVFPRLALPPKILHV
ncbi:MAG: hypothetical protein OXB96_03035 [Candidatus Kaiserbacteria bacterium]|nr:hypothetical protein [Candidatus Kaiserbacteria bacterium]